MDCETIVISVNHHTSDSYMWIVCFQPVLVPYLVTTIGHGKQDSDLQAQLNSCLKFLNTELKGKKHLIQVPGTSFN